MAFCHQAINLLNFANRKLEKFFLFHFIDIVNLFVQLHLLKYGQNFFSGQNRVKFSIEFFHSHNIENYW